jgi:hypothetical protein
MPVPKCIKCEYVKEDKYNVQTYRRCENEKVGARYIRGNEHKTSPKWCPLRNK